MWLLEDVKSLEAENQRWSEWQCFTFGDRCLEVCVRWEGVGWHMITNFKPHQTSAKAQHLETRETLDYLMEVFRKRVER